MLARRAVAAVARSLAQLRFAFQNDEKLYLVTDYYSGGSLFYHLRKSRGFPEVGGFPWGRREDRSRRRKTTDEAVVE